MDGSTVMRRTVERLLSRWRSRIESAIAASTAHDHPANGGITGDLEPQTNEDAADDESS